MTPEDYHKFLETGYNKITTLIEEGKWAEAHQACLEILLSDDENTKALKWKKKIEKKVHTINKRAIKTDLHNLKPLLKEKKYEEYLINIKKLEPYSKDYPHLKKILAKAKQKYEQYIQGKQLEPYLKEIKKIKDLFHAKNYETAWKTAEELKKFFLHSQILEKLMKKIARKLVKQKIKKYKKFLKSNNHEEILIFYHQLLEIDPDFKKLKKLFTKAKIRFDLYQFKEKKLLLKEALKKIKFFYREGEYEKTLELCKEILKIAPKNHQTKKYFYKTQKKQNKMINQEIIEQMESEEKKLNREYEAGKKDFTKI